jgi:SAM-dependent methyltransferase|tara:strand:- start:1086 stop:1706 length:621 start_codon:yes stop_codon:yes gene_type:complete
MLSAVENNNVRNVYQDIAHHFNNTRVYKWSWVVDFLNKFGDNNLILDLGCGNGRNMVHNNIKFIGIDNCDKFINICKGKGLEVYNSNITRINLKSELADGIICIAVFHHLSTVEHRIEALKEMKRLVKPGGKILISVWSINQPANSKRHFNNFGNNIVIWDSYGTNYERFYYIFEVNEIKELFKSVGLNLISHELNYGNEIFTLMS